MGFGKVVASIFVFGIGMITSGIMLILFKGSLVNRVKDLYWVSDTPFLNLMDVEYNIIAVVIMVTGLILIVLSGYESRSKEVQS